MEAVSRAALDPEQYKYSLTETRALLDAVQDWYSRRYGGVQLADEEIMAVCGSAGGHRPCRFCVRGAERPDPRPRPGLPDFLFRPADDRRYGWPVSAAGGKTTGSLISRIYRRRSPAAPKRQLDPIRTIRPLRSRTGRFMRGSWPMRASIKSSSCTITPISDLAPQRGTGAVIPVHTGRKRSRDRI